MSYIVPKEIPNCCGICPCFHAEHPMYCQAVKADKNKRIYAPYGEGRPDWCPLIEVPTPHGRLIDADALLTNTIYNPMSPPYITKEMVLGAKIVIGAEGGRGMTIVDVTKDSECCCSCIHNKRTPIDDVHVRCNCDKDGHYIGYVANFTCVCDEWEVTT